MLGRKDYTKGEYEHGKAAVDQQVAAYKKSVTAVSGKGSDQKMDAALEEFDVHFVNNMVLALDRGFVHRLRVATGKDCNPLNEVEMLCDSLINNNGVFRGNNVIQWIPDQTVLNLKPGDPIRLTEGDFEHLSGTFFTELTVKFLRTRA
jgi:hypothetical protein